ncbi:MAG: LapA family protein [Deltaproteobacteria bacterium]|nr:LapA family protein [Deltaproteobacteria bacterium]HEN20474.1 LapA family protein [Desulfobacteraceae bacterium]
MKHLKVIVVILFVLLVVIIAVQNYSPMSTSVKFRINLVFLNYETPEMSLYLVSIISFLVGVLFTGIAGIAERFQLKREIRILKRDAKEKDRELNSLRNLPVTAGDMSSDQITDV